jgi:hypothetical protein
LIFLPVRNPGHPPTVTVTTTTVSFSKEPGHEGEYLGATQTQRIDTTDSNYNYQRGATTTTAISQDQARTTVGNKAFSQAQTEAATPNRAAYFGRTVAKDAKAHPGKYVGAATGTVSGGATFLGYALAAGILGAVSAAGYLWDEVTHWR